MPTMASCRLLLSEMYIPVTRNVTCAIAPTYDLRRKRGWDHAALADGYISLKFGTRRIKGRAASTACVIFLEERSDV